MSDPRQNMTSFVDELAERNPAAVQLGEAISLAVRIEPELLRAARLTLTPTLDASAEADLWFSPLIESCTADWLVLVPEVAQELRRRLANEERRLGESR